MNSIDGLVMGRNTYEKVLSFEQWPYSKKVFVLSNSLKSVPNEMDGRIEIISGELNVLVNQLADRGYKNLYIDGGRVIQGFLNADLIDSMIITHIPILLGDGIPLFRKMPNRIKFDHIKTEVLSDQLVKSHYVKSNR